MPTDPTIHLVLPAYQEEAALPSLLERFRDLDVELGHTLSIIVVDDGSTDDTRSIAEAERGALRVRTISHATNQGLGQALSTGLTAALATAAPHEAIIVMDADDTHDVRLVPEMAARVASGHDVVIASRFVEGGDQSTAPAHRRLLSLGAAWVFKTLLGLSDASDFTSGFRAYRAETLQRAADHWGERLVVERGFACMVELLLNLRRLDPVISEVPLVLRYDRKPTDSKLRIGSTLVDYLRLGMRERLSPHVAPAAVRERPGDAMGDHHAAI